MLKTEAIKAHLLTHAQHGMGELYNHRMEVQVNVKAGPEKVKKGKGYYYTDPRDSSGETWAPFRIPWPDTKYKDNPLGFEPHRFDAIGLTGWDWFNKQSLWVGYDLDSIANHVKGLSDADLAEVQDLVAEVPWVTIRRSTSGKGLHVYVFFSDPPETANHTEHAALARSILGILSAHVGKRLEYKVDTSGQILWIWSDHQKPRGFELVKEGKFLDKVPHNWKDHCDIINRKATWTRTPGDTKKIDNLVIKSTFTPLNQGHKMLLGWFAKNHNTKMYWWDHDRNMLVCHTSDLKQAHEELDIKGPFETMSKGSDGGDQNCFLFPNISGWTVRRHGRGTPRTPSVGLG